jgi:hypothetical protein
MASRREKLEFAIEVECGKLIPDMSAATRATVRVWFWRWGGITRNTDHLRTLEDHANVQGEQWREDVRRTAAAYCMWLREQRIIPGDER